MGPFGWWLWVSSNKPVQMLRSLSSSKKRAFQERETEQTNKRTIPLTSERVISDSLLSSSSGLPSQVRSFLGNDPWMLKIGSLILRKTHRGPCNTAPHRGRISTGTKYNPLRPLTQQGFWNTESNEVFLVLFFSSELTALPVKPHVLGWPSPSNLRRDPDQNPYRIEPPSPLRGSGTKRLGNAGL